MDEVQTKVWLQSGILYSQINDVINLESIQKIEEKALELINQSKISGPVPMILILGNLRPGGFNVHISDVGKVVSSLSVEKYVSAVWTVGADDDQKRKGSILNMLFFGNRLKYVDTLEEAETEAKKLVAGNNSGQ